MNENWSRRESRLKGIKSRTFFLTKDKWNLFLGEAGEWNCDVQKIVDEPTVEVCKAEE